MSAVLYQCPIEEDLREEFERVLELGLVTTLYQPIVNIKNGHILGYEALSRGPKDSPLFSPLTLLSIAEDLNKTWELEQLLRVNALKNASFTRDYLLFLNVDPNIINDDSFQKGFTKTRLKEIGLTPSQVVLELTERSAIDNYEEFKTVLKHYKDQGFGIAIDDAGAGYSGLRRIYEVYPKYLKIDMDFVRGIDQDEFKQAIVKQLLETANAANIKTIAEGIETANELKTLIRLGVEFGQGYFIQKPYEDTPPMQQEVLNIISKENALLNQIHNYSSDYHHIHHLSEPIMTFSPDSKCIDVFNYLRHTGYSSVCITEQGYPMGMVTLAAINAVFAKQYGYAVYSKRPVSLIMNKQPLIMDYFASIQSVAQKALARKAEILYDDILVCQGSKYFGIVTMKDLLEYAINYEKNHAKELNPLTGLPGNVIINRVMQGAVSNERSSSVVYADLDNFKVYNDVYGFDNGDKIIKLAAKILDETIKEVAPYNMFIGHIGGDDFIFIGESNDETVEKICKEVTERFDKDVKQFFSEEDLRNGFVISSDRKGERQVFDITSISLAGVTGSVSGFESPEKLGEHLASLKKEAKKIPKSSYVLKSI